ncbi:hypothetical protein C8R47DRAFT_1224206, partial [Mycena vitilis]
MDDFITTAFGDHILPLWSLRDNTWFLSLGATPSAIPTEALKYMNPAPFLLKKTTPSEVIQAIDFSKGPVWYNPEEHWLSWAPLASPTSTWGDDPVGYLFDDEPVKLTDEYVDHYPSGDDGEDPSVPQEIFAGHHVDQEWGNKALDVAQRLHGICVTLTRTNSFYHKGLLGRTYGDMPDEVDSDPVRLLHATELGARKAIAATKRATLSLLGFISWFQTVKYSRSLSAADEEYVRSLRLDERPKAGVIYNLSRDSHEANLSHVLKFDVPVHIVWKEAIRKDWRFLRLRPEVWNEYATAKEANPGVVITLQDLPSYAAWKEDWDRSDWFFQNRSAGKRGDVVTVFKNGWMYQIVDFHHYGARMLTNWHEIRACAERFKAAVAYSPLGTTCTFFRQNPLGVDEPPFDRVRPNPHPHRLQDFATTEIDAISEEEIFFEATSVARERAKNLYAPRPDRMWNSYNGAPSMRDVSAFPRRRDRRAARRATSEAPSRSSSSYGEAHSHSSILNRLGPIPDVFNSPASLPPADTDAPTLKSEWARAMLISSRRRSSRSASPRRQDHGSSRRRTRSLSSQRTLESDEEEEQESTKSPFPDEYHGVRKDGPSTVAPEEDAAEMEVEAPIPSSTGNGSELALETGLSPITWGAGFQTVEQALFSIRNWASFITEPEPSVGEYNCLPWSTEWLAKSILVCEDTRSMWRLKTYAAVRRDITQMKDLLEIGIRFGIPFALYIKRKDVRCFRDSTVSPLSLNTLSALYQPGYEDLTLVWGKGGAPGAYVQYEANLNNLLSRPQAVAFIGLGGVLRYVAELYEENLVFRFAQGPSLQVTQFDKGEAYLYTRDGEEDFYTTDRVSHGEVGILLGTLPGAHPGQERTLWPTPEVFESESPHMRGYL